MTYWMPRSTARATGGIKVEALGRSAIGCIEGWSDGCVGVGLGERLGWLDGWGAWLDG